MSIFSQENFDTVKSKIMDHIVSMSPCIIDVDINERTYVAIKNDQVFQALLGESGSLDELYRVLFYQTQKDTESRNDEYLKYFKNEDVFRQDNLQTFVHFNVDGQEFRYIMFLTQYEDGKTVIFFQENVEFSDAEKAEKEKIDSIQDTYLFSMIVDLKENLCINATVTEVSTERQPYNNLPYDETRINISNMFMEEDRLEFLRASSPENIINTLEQKVKYHIDLPMMNMMGQYKWSRISFMRATGFSRENPRFIYTVYDIDEDMQNLLQRETITRVIEEKNKELMKAEKDKMMYIANLSHEVRNPINSIMGLNEVILRDTTDPEIRNYAKEIKVASKVLLNVVNDVLDISKISAGKMKLVPVEYNTADVVKSVSSLIKTRADSKALDYRVVIKDGVPSRVFGDDMRLMQVLINLLTNAVKYTDQGSITLCVEPEKMPDGKTGIRYTVSDTGIGIKPEEIELLFSDFIRLELQRNRKVEGTGLGMGIVNGILSAMNSKLEVESEYGKGSTFSFVLVQNVVDASPLSSDLNVNDKKDDKVIIKNCTGRKILVVDDMAANLRVFAALIKPYNATVHLANGPIRGLKFLDQFEYDLILVDHFMPEIDGVEFLKRIRNKGGIFATTPVVAMTGNYSATAKDEYKSFGFDDYMEKPITPEHIDYIINKYILDKI